VALIVLFATLAQNATPQTAAALCVRFPSSEYKMIYGEIISDESYYDLFSSLLKYVEDLYPSVESGIQGDAYIWIKSEEEKVYLDTFTSMRFQIKSNKVGGTLLEDVISKLELSYKVYLYQVPEREGHEDLI